MTDIALITTTINVPTVLMDYARDAQTHQRAVKFFVAGDHKTPDAVKDFCAQVTRETKVECVYLGVREQDTMMQVYPRLNAHLPYNCIQRRNVAALKAVQEGAQSIVTIDDDNAIVTPDYFSYYQNVGQPAQLDAFGTAGEWFNICRFLQDKDDRYFFPRGYGIAARSESPPSTVADRQEEMPVAVCAGLWLGDPDIDAATRIALSVDVETYTRDSNFFVARGAWTPFNSQNTALTKSAMSAYFLSPYVGRYDDILASFVVKRIADHFGDGISFGYPLVRQDRNEHDLLHDLSLEFLGTKITDAFVDALASIEIKSGSYAAALDELCDQAESRLADTVPMTIAERGQMTAFFYGCRIWADLPLW